MALNYLAPGAAKLAKKYALPYIKDTVLPRVGKSIFGSVMGTTKPKLKFNPDTYRDAFKKYEKDALARSRRMSREVGSQMGQRASVGGYQGTPMSNKLITQSQQRVSQGTLDMINKQAADLEMELAHAENMINMSGSLKERNHWTEVRDALHAALFGETLNPDTEQRPQQQRTALPNFDTSKPEDMNVGIPASLDPSQQWMQDYEPGSISEDTPETWEQIKEKYTTSRLKDNSLPELLEDLDRIDSKKDVMKYDATQPISWHNLPPEAQAITEQIGEEVSYWALQHFGPDFYDIFDFNKNVLDKVA